MTVLDEDAYQEFFQSISELAKTAGQIVRRAEAAYGPEVEAVIRKKIRDPRQIERLLDGMLDFCFDPALLTLFKRLCRYYYEIDPHATVEYVWAYREMWDTPETEDAGEE